MSSPLLSRHYNFCSLSRLKKGIVNAELLKKDIAVKDKRYADKPETIDALKHNIRETIGKIHLHAIDNVLKIGLIV